VWQVDAGAAETTAIAWKRLFGISQQAPLRLEYDSENKNEAKGAKIGKFDGKEHHGGNTWNGGTGGSDTAGLGGKGGPYRQDGGFEVHQISDEEKAKTPEHVTAAAREIAKKELDKRLKQIDMGLDEHEMYNKYVGKVTKQVPHSTPHRCVAGV
jgi:hypothetical protein